MCLLGEILVKKGEGDLTIRLAHISLHFFVLLLLLVGIIGVSPLHIVTSMSVSSDVSRLTDT